MSAVNFHVQSILSPSRRNQQEQQQQQFQTAAANYCPLHFKPDPYFSESTCFGTVCIAAGSTTKPHFGEVRLFYRTRKRRRATRSFLAAE